jgi:hypothetical protein
LQLKDKKMFERNNNNTDRVMPDASPELTEIVNSAVDSADLKLKLQEYYTRKGLAVVNNTHTHFTVAQDPDGCQFSRIVTLANGRRTMITGARSEAELDSAERALRSQS